MLENGEPIGFIKPKYKHLMFQRGQGCCNFNGAIDNTNEDHWIHRTAIKRAGHWVARYNGYYHQINGGIRTPFFLSEIKQGKY